MTIKTPDMDYSPVEKCHCGPYCLAATEYIKINGNESQILWDFMTSYLTSFQSLMGKYIKSQNPFLCLFFWPIYGLYGSGICQLWLRGWVFCVCRMGLWWYSSIWLAVSTRTCCDASLAPCHDWWWIIMATMKIGKPAKLPVIADTDNSGPSLSHNIEKTCPMISDKSFPVSSCFQQPWQPPCIVVGGVVFQDISGGWIFL